LNFKKIIAKIAKVIKICFTWNRTGKRRSLTSLNLFFNLPNGGEIHIPKVKLREILKSFLPLPGRCHEVAECLESITRLI